jgi:multidrug efflux pump
MLGVTLFGIFLTPVFYSVIQWFTDRRIQRREAAPAASDRARPLNPEP